MPNIITLKSNGNAVLVTEFEFTPTHTTSLVLGLPRSPLLHRSRRFESDPRDREIGAFPGGQVGRLEGGRRPGGE